jgi:hypothetical protein
MSSAIVSPTAFDSSKVTFSPVKLLESGGKQAYLNYDSRSLVMQIGSLSVPYGMSVFDKAGPVKYSVELSLRGYDGENKKVQSIYQALAALDEYMITQGVKNSRAWFKSDLNKDVIKAFYTPTIRFSKDADGNPKPYPPTLKLALRQKNDKFDVAVYDDKKRPLTDIPLEDVLVKGAQITTLIQCTGVWFAGSKYGLSWKAVQIRVDKLPESIRGFAFIDEGDSETPATTARRTAPAPVSQSAPQNTFASLADDDEEDEEVDDDEVIPAPAPAPVAKKVVAPAPAPVVAEINDDDGEDMAPVAVPKKVVTTKKVVSVTKKK